MRHNAAALYVVYLNVVLYSICYMMQQPALPYLTDKLGASTAEFASLQSLFNGAQAIGGVLSGPFLDVFGGKALLLISFAASVVCYGLTAVASSLTLLYVSRLTTLLQHAVLAARSIVATSTREEDRARHLGYVGMCVGMGMSSGPMIGGLMSDKSLSLSSWMAMLGSVVSFVLVLLFVPSDAPRKVAPQSPPQPDTTGKAQDSGDGKGSSSSNGTGKEGEGKGPPLKGPSIGIAPFLEVLRAPGVADLMSVKMASNMASALFQGMMATVMKAQGMTPRHVGAAMSLVGVAAIVVQGFMVAPAIKAWGESRTQLYSCWGLLLGFLLLASAKGFVPMMVALVPMAVATILLTSVSTARLTKVVPKTCTGTALSLDMGLWSAVRMAAPVLGAQLLELAGAPGISGTSAAIMAMLLGAIYMGLVKC